MLTNSRIGQFGEAVATDGRLAPWDALRSAALDTDHLLRHRVITATRADPANITFGQLRTRMSRALRTHGWSRVGITSAGPGCGKTFVASNLALSFARQASCRVALVDLDLRLPNLARVLGVPYPGQIRDFLNGHRSTSEHFLRAAPNLALGLNATPVPDPAELLQEPSTAQALGTMITTLRPDVVLYDLPPALVCDDVLAFLPRLDCILLVAGGGISKAEDIRQCERLFEGQIPLLGVLLNRSEDKPADPYGSYEA